MAWTRQYRPRKVADLHLSRVKEQLLQQMKKGVFPQVMLFAGPKGTGKTTTARLIGAILNDSENEKLVKAKYLGEKIPAKAASNLVEAQWNDQTKAILAGNSFIVQELDAASHRGIEDIRQLKETTSLPPQAGLMSVFILDEAHMLTTPAFNALLKLLEEPPPHAVFILATTELHKIPATVQSRAQLVQFTQASQAELLDALNKVCQAEEISAETEALEQIAKTAGGSFRDAIKWLEMATTEQKVTVEQLSALGLLLESQVWQLIDAIIAKNAKAVVDLFTEARAQGIGESAFTHALFTQLHQDLITSLTSKSAKLSDKVSRYLIQAFASHKYTTSPIAFLSLELVALDLIARASQKNGQSSTKSASRPKTAVQPTVKASQSEVIANSGDPQKLLEKWDDFLAAVENLNVTVAALLRSAKPIGAADQALAVEVYYRFHREQLLQPKTQSLLRQAMNRVVGEAVTLDCRLAQSPQDADLVEPEVVNSLTQMAAQALI